MADIRSICIVTSVHPEFDARIWRHATGLAALGIEVHLVCPWNVATSEVREGVHLHPFDRVQRRILRPLLIPMRVLPKVLKLLGKVQLVHFHDIDLLPYMALLGLARPVVYDVHENYPEEVLVRPYRFVPNAIRPVLYHLVRWGQWLFANMLKNVVLVVPSQRQDFWGGRLRIHCLWNYASERLADGRIDDYLARGKVVSFPGSQYKENGSLILLDIAAEVRKQVAGVVFRITDRFHGDKAFREEFLAKRDMMALQETVLLVPNLPANQIMEELNLARVGVVVALPVPKIFRAMPNKLFEFMAAGIPIVSFDYPYPRDIIDCGRCGYLVEPLDVREFSEKLVYLLTNAEQARVLGGNGAATFTEKYNWEAQMPKLLDYYRSILN